MIKKLNNNLKRIEIRYPCCNKKLLNFNFLYFINI